MFRLNHRYKYYYYGGLLPDFLSNTKLELLEDTEACLNSIWPIKWHFFVSRTIFSKVATNVLIGWAVQSL